MFVIRVENPCNVCVFTVYEFGKNWTTRLNSISKKGILENVLSCSLHKIGTNLIEKVVDLCLHPESTNQTIQGVCKRMTRSSRKTEVDTLGYVSLTDLGRLRQVGL